MAEGLEAGIKKYTEQLAQDPKSRVFVPLCDIYRQLGRYEEAIAVAQEGLKAHPTYLSGKIALARAYFENGDADPALELIEAILSTSPDNLLANRILAEICIHKGDRGKASDALNAILSVEPGDARARKMLDSLAPAPEIPVPPPPAPALPEEPKAPLRTPTLAELYRLQGHLKEALEVYLELSERDPSNPTFAAKVLELNNELAPKQPPVKVSGGGQAEFLQRLMGRIQERRRAL